MVVVVTGATVSCGRTVVGVVVTGCLGGAETTSCGAGGSAGGVATDVVVVVVGEGVELAVVRMCTAGAACGAGAPVSARTAPTTPPTTATTRTTSNGTLADRRSVFARTFTTAVRAQSCEPPGAGRLGTVPRHDRNGGLRSHRIENGEPCSLVDHAPHSSAVNPVLPLGGRNASRSKVPFCPAPQSTEGQEVEGRARSGAGVVPPYVTTPPRRPWSPRGPRPASRWSRRRCSRKWGSNGGRGGGSELW